MRHPSEFFIKYLILSDRTRTDAAISTMVTDLFFPQVDPTYLQQLRATLEPKVPPTFTPLNRYHRESVRFLRTEGIWSLFNPDEAVRQATNLISNLRARALVEQLLIGNIETKDIAKKVNARCNEHFVADDIEAYRHYYWNVALLRFEDWKQLTAGDGNEDLRNRTLPIVHGGAAMALRKAGFEQRIESKTLMRDMMQEVYFDFREWAAQPRSETRTRALTALSKAVCGIDVQLNQADAAIRESLKEFEKFRMQHSKVQVIDIQEVAPAGNFSRSGAKLLEPPPDPNDDSED